MRKILAIIIVFLFVCSSVSCKLVNPAGNDPGYDVIAINSTETAQQPTLAPDSEAPVFTPAPETTPAPTGPMIDNGRKNCFYGENTGTDKTFTGLEPLPLSDFNNPPMQNTENLSTETIDHAFGIARDGKPHDISVYNQNFFDSNGLSAFCYDNKTTEKILYLTFDCGYENGYTAKILDTLLEKNVKAAFFCTLPELRSNTEIMARIVMEGHILGNHSCTHPDFSSLTRSEMYREVKGFDDYLRTNFGYSSLYFRYPMGKHSIDSTTFLNEMGFTCVFWSLAYSDWDLNNQKGADYALQTVTERLHPGAVILLHAVSPDNANALGSIIDTARSMGYEFRSLSDYEN